MCDVTVYGLVYAVFVRLLYSTVYLNEIAQYIYLVKLFGAP